MKAHDIMRKGYRTVMFIGFVLFGILINVQLRSTLASNPMPTHLQRYAIELEKERNEGKRLMEQLAVKEAELEQFWQNLGTNSNNQEINELLRKGILNI